MLSWLVRIVDVLQFIPQARRTLGSRHDQAAMEGLSTWTWAIATAQGTAWVVSGFGEWLWPIAVPNLVITPMCAMVLGLRVLRLRRS